MKGMRNPWEWRREHGSERYLDCWMERDERGGLKDDDPFEVEKCH